MNSVAQELLKAYSLGERDFKKVDLSGVDLAGADFSGADFSKAILSSANLREVNFRGAILNDADLSSAILSRANLNGVSLDRADLSRAEAISASFVACSARCANFADAMLIRSIFRDADCMGAYFPGADLTACNAENANWECCDFEKSNLTNASLINLTLNWANMSFARLNWAKCAWSAMEASDMSWANLTGCDMTGVRLNYANLENAVISGTDLNFASLEGTMIYASPSQFSRISSCRLYPETFVRSSWTKEMLAEWLNAGATMIQTERLPENVQAFIRESITFFRLEFSKRLSDVDQCALNYLLSLASEDKKPTILTVHRENDHSIVSLSCKDTSLKERYTEFFLKKRWQEHPHRFARNAFSSSLRHIPDDVDSLCPILDALSDSCTKIELLTTEDVDKKAQKMRSIIENKVPDSSSDHFAKVSWSSVKMQCVPPRDLSEPEHE